MYSLNRECEDLYFIFIESVATMFDANKTADRVQRLLEQPKAHPK